MPATPDKRRPRQLCLDVMMELLRCAPQFHHNVLRENPSHVDLPPLRYDKVANAPKLHITRDKMKERKKISLR